MGRNQTFDTAAAVRAARAVFWARGYEATALPDLERATGLSRSSIYHAFASKRGLFDAAVDSYLDEVVRPRLRPLTEDDVAPDALDHYLTGLRDALLRGDTLPATSGCLLVNAANAPIGQDDGVAAVVEAYAAELRTAMAAGVRARLPHLADDATQTLSDVCTGLVISAFALVRVDRAEAARSLDTARAVLASAVAATATPR
ncbi:TetR/AcrR family transcriptional regulator [Cellulomonas sp. IC4_254]|uniref:TetR/AcrR family transcriptional regulator n=1 Tax=Cellulomonas sp. IC4_254 TaxID=2714040 RepID=UPI001420F873|nr:TetR/AcrR family transcriptional regulator [Cellulomonas sp. IC4_254]NHT17470.1 helix-turn-helix transcriptional regulator [Cellulomonas sp. IC4_254]